MFIFKLLQILLFLHHCLHITPFRGFVVAVLPHSIRRHSLQAKQPCRTLFSELAFSYVSYLLQYFSICSLTQVVAINLTVDPSHFHHRHYCWNWVSAIISALCWHFIRKLPCFEDKASKEKHEAIMKAAGTGNDW